QGGMGRIAERIQDGGHFVRYRVGQLEDVEGGHGDVLRESTGPADADADGVAAQVTAPGPAIAADAAGDVSLRGYAVAGHQAAHLAAAFDDLAAELVTYDERHRDRVARPIVPLVDVDIGAADGDPAHFYQDVVVPGRRQVDVLHPDAGLRPG